MLACAAPRLMCMTIVLVGMLHLGQEVVVKFGTALSGVLVLAGVLAALSVAFFRALVDLTVALFRVCLVSRPVASPPVGAGVA